MGDFFFNGRWASDLGLTVERYPRQGVPEKSLTTYQIPGRSEPLTQWDGSFKTFVQRYECWFKATPVRLSKSGCCLPPPGPGWRTPTTRMFSTPLPTRAELTSRAVWTGLAG